MAPPQAPSRRWSAAGAPQNSGETPLAHALPADVAVTAVSAELMPGLGAPTVCHDDPFQCSTSVVTSCVIPNFVVWLPTAHTSPAGDAATELSCALPDKTGPGTTCHDVPSQCSTRGWLLPLVDPIAHAFVADVAATEVSTACPPGLGLDATDHFVPSQCSISAVTMVPKELETLWLPTAHASVPDVPVTELSCTSPDRTGPGTTVHDDPSQRSIRDDDVPAPSNASPPPHISDPDTAPTALNELLTLPLAARGWAGHPYPFGSRGQVPGDAAAPRRQQRAGQTTRRADPARARRPGQLDRPGMTGRRGGRGPARTGDAQRAQSARYHRDHDGRGQQPPARQSKTHH
jgi:hypothetical protein